MGSAGVALLPLELGARVDVAPPLTDRDTFFTAFTVSWNLLCALTVIYRVLLLHVANHYGRGARAMRAEHRVSKKAE